MTMTAALLAVPFVLLAVGGLIAIVFHKYL